jgi:hypothetical protein
MPWHGCIPAVPLLQEATVPDQIKVGIDGITNRGQNFIATQDMLAIEPCRLCQANPTLNPAFLYRIAIVIDDSLAPGPAEVRVIAARKNYRVLDRNAVLVVIAIQGLCLHLPAA